MKKMKNKVYELRNKKFNHIKLNEIVYTILWAIETNAKDFYVNEFKHFENNCLEIFN